MAKMNFSKIRDEVKSLVRTACFSPRNKFTETVWSYHIVPVVNHSLALGKKLKADREVLELAAYLHDYAGVKDFKLYEEHHYHGANLAEKILTELKYDQGKIELIKECILSHRGSVVLRKKSLEARILASADAMSHITEGADMFYLVYGVHRFKTAEGAAWLEKKLARSWRKIMPEGREMIRDDYRDFKKLLRKGQKIECS